MRNESATIQSARPPVASFAGGRWLLPALVALLAVALAISNWTAIATMNLELGDFAANSLLIQDAKSLSLLYGNYSRVGFNHPGPAILYVLAFGELVFHDWLHLVPSPFSGQLLAVPFYNAAWLAAIFAIVMRSTASRIGALLFMSGFALALAYSDFQIFAGIWFPHLYVLPFAVMILSASRIALGKTDSVVALGVSTGFLINGHVSFVAIAGIVLICVLLGNLLLAKRGAVPGVLSPAFLRTHRGAVVRLIVIVALFLVPFAIACVLDNPSPVSQYLSFSKGNKGNSLMQAVVYVAGYWEGLHGLVTALALGIMIGLVARRREAAGGMASGLLIAMLGGTIALLYYAKVGIDLLQFKYIGLFYYAVPAFALGLLLQYAYCAMRQSRTKSIVALVLAAAMLVTSFQKIHRSPDYTGQFNQPHVAEWYEALRGVNAPGRLVLDLDNAVDWGNVWTHVLGIEIYAKRRNVELFCVNRNWHISFTKAAICTPEELATSPRFLVRPSGPADSALGTPVIDKAGLSFFRLVPPDLAKVGPVTVAARPDWFGAYILKSGWSAVESEFAWSLGDTAELALRVDRNFAGRLVLDLMAFIPKVEFTQQLTVSIDGQQVKTLSFSHQQNRQQLVVPIAPRTSDALPVTLKILRPISPQEAGLSGDPRPLGVALYGITVEGNN